MHGCDEVNFKGILSWTVDQHRGQAKGTGYSFFILHNFLLLTYFTSITGIGEFLQAISPPNKADLYEAPRLLSELGPYEHLERILRICIAHYGRNIKKTKVSQDVKNAMFSLAGAVHKDGALQTWEDTLAFICSEGGKAGQGAQ